MKQFLRKGMVVVLVVVGLVAVAQPALAWVRVGVNVGVPFPVFVGPVAVVAAGPAVYGPPVPVHYYRHYRPIAYRPVWAPGHLHRWGAWHSGHWR